MKKIIVNLIILMSIATNVYSKVIMVEEPGYGQIGLMMNCGVPLGEWVINGDNTELLDYSNSIKFGASLFYDFSYFDSKLGLLIGWDATYVTETKNKYTKNELYNNNFKLGFRAYRFITAGPLVGFNKGFDTDKTNIDAGAFIGITILPFKYCGIGIETQWTKNCGLSVMGSFSITIPTQRKK